MLVILHYDRKSTHCGSNTYCTWHDEEMQRKIKTWLLPTGRGRETLQRNSQRTCKKEENFTHCFPLWRQSWHRICQRLGDPWSLLHPEQHISAAWGSKKAVEGSFRPLACSALIFGLQLPALVIGLSLWPILTPEASYLAQGVEGLDLANWDFGKGLLSTWWAPEICPRGFWLHFQAWPTLRAHALGTKVPSLVCLWHAVAVPSKLPPLLLNPNPF